MNAHPSDGASAATRRSARFATGRVLAGRYELRQPLGEGGTAEVYRALDHRLDRDVAVKVLRPEFGHDADARNRFAVEARSAAALNVSNIVPVYDFGAADDGSLFIVMRFIDGPSLRRVLEDRATLPTAAALDLSRQIADALAAAHTHGLIHRDVKPGNILIDRAGTAHLTDFGTVKALVGGDDLTRSGTIFGTAAYLSPEQATGGRIGPYTDVYALGVVLYEALSGQPPFTGDDPVAISYRHAHEMPRPVDDLVPGVDREISDVVMACLAKAPEQRPADAARLASMLDIVGRRLAPRGGGRRLLAQLAATIPIAGSTALARLAAQEPEKETVALPVAAVGAGATAAGLAPPAHRPPASPPVSPAFPPPSPPTHDAWDRPHMERGVIARGPRESASDRRSGALGAALLVALLLVLVGASVFVFTTLLRPGDEDPGLGVVPTPSDTTRRPSRTEPVVVTAPTPAPVATPTPTPVILTPAPVTPAPVTPAPITPEPATPAPVTPPPATELPPPTVVPPAPGVVVQRIPDRLFVGDFHGDDNGTYHGRSASWVYGQDTPYSTMTATLELDVPPAAGQRATLELVGLDGENPVKNMIRIVLNGVTIYEGPNPLPDDFCCGGSGPGNWGSAVIEFPSELLTTTNALSITNLEPNDCTACPKFVMLDRAVLTYPAAG